MQDHLVAKEGDIKTFIPISQSEKLESRLLHIDPRIDPLLFQQMIVTHLLGDQPLSGMSVAKQRVLAFRVEIEIEHDLDFHISKYNRYLANTENARDRARIEEIVSFHGANLEFQEEIKHDETEEDVCHLPEIDRPVASGGLTKLHIAAAAGDLNEVKRLIEEDGAVVGVVDTYRMTPLGRAEMMGFTKVIDYLKSCV